MLKLLLYTNQSSFSAIFCTTSEISSVDAFNSSDIDAMFWFSCAEWTLENSDSMTFFIMFSNSPYIDNLSKEEASRNFKFIFELIQQAIDEEILINVNTSLIVNYLLSSVQAFANFVKDNPDKLEEYLDVAFRMFWRSVANI